MPNIGAPELAILLLIWVGSIVPSVWLAAEKGYSPAVWPILAFFFAWITLVVLLVLPSKVQAPPFGGTPEG